MLLADIILSRNGENNNRMINWCVSRSIFVWHIASGHNSITKGKKLEEKQIKNFKRRPGVYFECHICKYIC